MIAATKSTTAETTTEMRAVYGATLLDLAEKDDRIVVLDADLMRANGTTVFRDAFPDRTIDVGVAEANMIGIAAGLSATGLIPFPATFSCFASRRVFDQFFISANYARRNVKLTGSDPGIAALLNGGTHMCFEDIGLMRTIPGITIYEPCDPVSLEALLRESAYASGCSYLRLHRKPITPIYDDDRKFELGRGVVVRDGYDVTIIATGAILVPQAIQAATILENEGLSAAVIDMHTVKPIDAELIVTYAQKCGAIVTCENHQVCGGLGSAVAEVLVEHVPVPMERIGVHDMFGEVGDMDYLLDRFGLDSATIAEKARIVIDRKQTSR